MEALYGFIEVMYGVLKTMYDFVEILDGLAKTMCVFCCHTMDVYPLYENTTTL